MLWRRSRIIDIKYFFPGLIGDLIFDRGSARIDAKILFGDLRDAFDPDNYLDYEDALLEQDLIYTVDTNNVIIAFYNPKDWTGPDMSLGDRIEWIPPLEDCK